MTTTRKSPAGNGAHSDAHDSIGNGYQSTDSTDKFASLRLAHADGCVLDEEPAGGDL